MKLHFLIIRFSSIGDIILTSPLMRCLKSKYPNCQITFVTKKAFETLLEHSPYIDEVISYDGNLKELKSKLARKQFSQVFDLHNNIRSKSLAWAINAPYASFNKLNLEKWLLVQFKINRLPSTHIVDRYLQSASKFNLEYDGKGLDFFFAPSFQTHPAPPTPFITLAIGGQHATKRMPLIKLGQLIQSLDFAVVLIGGKEEMKDAELLQMQFPNKIAYNYCGKCSLFESADLVRRSELLITHDTGMMHIGAALNIPIFSLWGNTIPEFGMYPLFPQGSKSELCSKRFEVSGLSCRPCSKIGYDRCPKGHFNCMMKQNTDDIALAANQLLMMITNEL